MSGSGLCEGRNPGEKDSEEKVAWSDAQSHAGSTAWRS